jgi:hypothetical protein
VLTISQGEIMSQNVQIAEETSLDFGDLDLGDLNFGAVEIIQSADQTALPETGASCLSCCDSCCCSSVIIV